jgi:hypothetical protein
MVNIDQRINKLAVQLHPFRDTGCMIKTITDKALQGKIVKMLSKYVEGWRHENTIDELNRIEELIKETR